MSEGQGKCCGDISDEKLAFRLVELYFDEIAHSGFKRRLDLDSMVNAYFYVLQRLKNKDKELMLMAKLVAEQEKKMTLESKEELFPTLFKKE